MKIDRHISTLLYNHDCVIVPSFGGFLASYQSSVLQGNSHTFSPPSKKIAFNVFLKNNDGLLANYVAEREKLTYTNALKSLERFRFEIVKMLNSGKRIVIEDVGTLFYDQHKNLQFEPVKTINYLEGAFGLTPVQSPPVKRDEQRKKIERQLREAVSIRSSVKTPRANSFNKRITVKKILNTFLISGAVLWFSFNVYLIAPHAGNRSSLNPFSYSSSPAKVETPVTKPTSESERVVASAAAVQKAEYSNNAGASAEQSAEDNSLALTSPPSFKKPTSELETIIQNQKNFYIIAGVFREPGNAEKMVESLKKEGFVKAEIIDPTASVKKVCYSSFAYKKDAVDALQQLHSLQREGWLMAK